MKIIFFRSRLRAGVDADAYHRHAEALYGIASTIPGFVSAEDFAGDGGQRLAVIAFRDDESLAEWRNHPVHRAAQERGRDEYYESYTIQVCELERESTFPAGSA
jgi:heme-degrading monooxygenase HmoA